MSRLFVVLCLSAYLLPGNSAWAAKPGSPLSIVLSTEQPYQAGEEVTVKVTVQSAIAMNRVRISVHPPAGMSLIDGELGWQGAVSASTPVEFRFRCRLPELGVHRIGVTGSSMGNPSARFAAHASIMLGQREKALSKQRELRKKQSLPDGRTIREYPLQ